MESGVDFGSGFGVGDEPHFGFGFPMKLSGEVLWWVHLEAEILAGVEDFHEEGEARGGMGGEGGAEEPFAVLGPEGV